MRTILWMCLLFIYTAKGQNVFYENMHNGNGGTTGDSISVHQNNQRFTNTSLTFSGNGLMRTTSASIAADYLNASGGFNIELDTNQYVMIDGIDALGFSDLLFSLALRKGASAEDGSNLKVYYSETGINGTFIPLNFDSLITGTSTTGWYYRTTKEVIPNTVTTLKIEAFSNNWRIDDLSLFTATSQIFVTGNHHLISHNQTSVNVIDFTNFGTVTANYGYQTYSYEVENKGQLPLIISGINLSNTTDFYSSTTFPITIQPNQKSSISITYKPLSVGNHSCTVSVLSNDKNQSTFDFMISGTATTITHCAKITEILAQQTFENNSQDNWNYTYEKNSGAGNSQVAGGTLYGTSGMRKGSDLFLDTQSFQVNNNSSTLTLNTINTLGYENISFHFRLGAYSSSAGNGADVSDYVTLQTSTDNGGTWVNQFSVQGFNNAKWSLTSGLATATAFYSENDTFTVFKPTTGGYKTTDGYNYINLNQLPQTENLTIRLLINNSLGNETWALDNFEITGTKAAIQKWTNQTWTNVESEIEYASLIIEDDYDSAVHGSLSGCTCQIHPDKTLKIQSGDYLKIHGNINNQGNLIVENSGSLIQVEDTATNTGSGDFKRKSVPMKRYDYTYWSSPVQSQTLQGYSSQGPYYEYDTTNNQWKTASGIMQPAKGYIIRTPENVDYNNSVVVFNGAFKGIPNNGVITTSVYHSSSKWNLIGNPYPSALDADAFLNLTDNQNVLGGTLYFWTHQTERNAGKYSADDYALYNQTGGTAANSGGEIPLGYIASGQAFFIEGLQNGVATFNNQMRALQNNQQFFKSSSKKSKDRFWLELKNESGAFKQILIGHILGATNEIDRNFDGASRKSDNPIQFFTLCNEKEWSIQGRVYPAPSSEKIPLGYSVPEAGIFSIQLAKTEGVFTQEMPVVLYDSQTKTHHFLQEKPYTFETAAGKNNTRFFIQYQEPNLTITNENINESNPLIQVSSTAQGLTIYSEDLPIQSVRVYNQLGQLLVQEKEIHQHQKIITQNIPLGLNILQIELINGKIITKKHLQNPN